MKLLLTSMGIIGVRENGVKVDAYLNEKNGFVDRVKELLTTNDTFVFIASDKLDFEHNDMSCNLNIKAFNKHGITFKNSVVIDDRNKDDIERYLACASLIFLQGGDVAEENLFFKEIDLKNKLINTGAIDHSLIIGQSAGSMNLGHIVYVFPDLDAKRDDYPKFIKGLGFSVSDIIPHYDIEKGNAFIPDNINLIDDYFIPDSVNMTFYALLDGSYICVNDKNETVYGESYLIQNGKISKLCNNDDYKVIVNNKDEKVNNIDTSMCEDF
ncbi:MAG: Type 1 glutamine amidotransferase-like domain-containing protein [Clostridia bacterium]|nr:Type 1 glutamine amidotransferase-like domain-containing protein [Clostridia bacterium]